jgi:dihydrofolate reductase
LAQCLSDHQTSVKEVITMRKLIVAEWMSLDGVVQAPIERNEDTSGGFQHGGWHRPYLEDTAMKWVLEGVTSAGGFVLGRGTYELFAAHWPNAPEQERPLAEPLNQKPKYVASRTLATPLAWANSTVLGADVGEAVASLKQQKGGDLLVIGSPKLVTTLLARDLVDELRLMIDPVVLGGGKRFFSDDGALRQLHLAHSQVTSTGAVLVTYERQA